MKLKTYETPEAELLRISVDRNFCESGDVPDFILDDTTIEWVF